VRVWVVDQVEDRAAAAEDDVLHDDGLAVGRNLVLARRLAGEVDGHGKAVVHAASVAGYPGPAHGHGKGHEALAVLGQARLLHGEVANNEGLVVFVGDIVLRIAQGAKEKVLEALNAFFGKDQVREEERNHVRVFGGGRSTPIEKFGENVGGRKLAVEW
jgi:hypothetical protein